MMRTPGAAARAACRRRARLDLALIYDCPVDRSGGRKTAWLRLVLNGDGARRAGGAESSRPASMKALLILSQTKRRNYPAK